MKEVIKFLAFIIYATTIFFMPNQSIVLVILVINIIVMWVAKIRIKDTFKNIIKFVPFILFTVVVNCILADAKMALWVGIKLLLVCNITFLYSKTTTVGGISKTIALLCTPLKWIKVNVQEIEILVAISLAMIPILKQEYKEVQEACRAKNMQLNISNMKVILSKLFLATFKRVGEIDEALLEKGCDL